MCSGEIALRNNHYYYYYYCGEIPHVALLHHIIIYYLVFIKKNYLVYFYPCFLYGDLMQSLIFECWSSYSQMKFFFISYSSFSSLL